MKKIITLLFLIQISIVNSQNNSWKKINSQDNNLKSKLTSSKSNEIDLYSIDLETFKKDIETQKIITLPNFYGEFSDYLVIKTSNFTQEISNKYSRIKSYSLQGIKDKTATGKLSIGTDGIHIMIFSGEHKTFHINPYQNEKTTYAAHLKGALEENKDDFICGVEDEITTAKDKVDIHSHKNANDSKLRIFRLALACTGEYAQFHIDNQGIANNASDTVKEEAILSAMNTTITRVNAVFERDLAVRFEIVLNSSGTNDLIFLDPETDDLSNDSASLLIAESQTLCDDIIGSNNYDIGHTFSTGAGGLAGLGVICRNGQKGRGVTGRTSPTGDSFDIDFVAHEIGHQFGASHTFNGSGGNCDDANRSNSTSVEPASGTTIMSYAGICSPINVQNNSDDYFHAVSIANMWDRIERTSCATEVSNNNNPPIINLENTTYNVPVSTPLILKGEATDSDSNSLTYCWEQIDTDLVTVPLTTNIVGPAFRSLAPSSSPNRHLPSLETVVRGNTSSQWEAIPDVARQMNFALTVRDNQGSSGGATAREDISINFIGTDPFSVNTPNTLSANTNQTITWNVGETNISPINSTKVNIKLSADGGNTFPFTIIENTDNDGTQQVVIPGVSTTNAIILVEASDNVFYNISDPFEIINSNEISLSNTTGEVTICNGDEITYQINYAPGSDLSETVSFNITDKPSNANVTISPTSLSQSGTITVTVSNLSNFLNGDYSLTLTADSPSIIQNINLDFQKISEHCASSGNTFDETSITQVDFATISNSSVKSTSGYTNFKSISTTVNKGETHNLNVQVDTDGNFETRTKAWIDWNQNCVFDQLEEYDLGETINVIDEPTTNSPLTIIVPEDAELGSTIMRVIIRYIGDGSIISSSCETDFLGETEEYTIIVNDPTASLENNTFNNFSLYPNPSNGIFNLNFEILSGSDKTIIHLIDIAGRVINKKEYNSTSNVFSEQLNFSNLNSGIYLLQVINGSKQTIEKIIIE